MAKNKLKVKLTGPHGGAVGGVESPVAGTIIEMDADVAKQMVKEGTAEFEDPKDAEEEEPKRKTSERGGARVEEARAEAPEKRGK